MASSSKSTTTNSPPAWASDAFKRAGADALKLYESGEGGNTYMGSTVAPLSGTTMQGVNQLANAGANWNTGQTRDLFGGIGSAAVSNPFVNQLGGVANDAGNTRNVGVSAYTNAAGRTAADIGNTGQRLYDPIATGQQGITTGSQWNWLFGQAGKPTSAETNLTDMASGKWLKEGNPYFNARLEDQLADTAAQTRSLYSGMGRGNSGVENRVLTDRIGNLRTDALAQDWDRNLTAQLAATGQIDAARNAAVGNQTAALSGLTGAQSANIQNRLAAAGGLVNALGAQGNLQRGVGSDIAGIMTGNADRQLAGQTVQGNLLTNAGNMYGQGLDRATTAANAMRGIDQQNFENRLAGADATLQAGGILDQQGQRLLSDDVAKFESLDNQGWQRLAMLEAAASGAAGPYGTQVNRSSSFSPMSVLGGVGGLMKGK